MRTHAPLLAFLALGPLCLPAAAQTPPTPAADQTPLTLQQVTALAFQSSPSLSAAQFGVTQASARVSQAQAQKRFQITFNSTASTSNAHYPTGLSQSFGTYQNTLTVPLPFGSRPGLLVRQAQEQRGAAAAQLDSARLALTGQVAIGYYDILRKQALLSIAQLTLAENTRALADVQKRNGAGDAAQIDVLQAQVPVAAARATLDGAGNDLAVAREILNSLLGRPLDTLLLLADVPPNLLALPYTLTQAQAFVLERSPDLRAAEATIRADQAAVSAARLYREPTYAVQAIDIRSKDVTSFLRQDTLQAAITLPLTDGGLGRAQVQEASAALLAAQAQRDAIRRQVLAGVSAAYLTAQSRRRQIESARTAQAIAQITYDKTTLGYREGLFPLLQVLTARAALNQARLAYTQALYDAAAASTALSTAFAGATLTLPTTTSPPLAIPTAPPTGAAGTSPAGAGTPGTSPAGNSTTGPGAGGAGAGGRGAP